MPFKEEYQVTTLTGQVPIIVLAAPAVDEVIVMRNMYVDNKDAVGFVVTFWILASSTAYGFNITTIPVGTDQGTEVDIGDNRIVLNATNQFIISAMNQPIDTTAPVVTVHFAREG